MHTIKVLSAIVLTVVAAAASGPREVSRRADSICVLVAITGTVNFTPGEQCRDVPFPTKPFRVEDGLKPYVWVVFEVKYP